MIKIVLIGGGNLAWHLVHVFSKTDGVELAQVYNRTLESIKEFENFTQITDNLNEIVPSDIVMICVSDDAIQNISQSLYPKNALIVHTSGATSMDILKKHERIGIFYPLQSFTKNRVPDFTEIPICIEAKNEKDLDILKILAQKISGHVYEIDSEQRKKIHVAAVLVNNFTNHLYHLGYNFLKENKINPQILFPLIKETALRIEEVSPFLAQTGPAKRHDLKTVENHLELLKSPTTKEIYKLISRSISDIYEKKL